jgi:hypothetical protein
MGRLGLALAFAVTSLAGTLGLNAPAQAQQVQVASCESTSASCWDGGSPTPWSYDLSDAQLTALGLGTSQPLIADQTGCCVIRLGSLQILFQTGGGPVLETAPEYNGDGSDGAVTVADYLIPVDATSAVISGTFGNSTTPNTSLEVECFGSGPCLAGVPEPAPWAMMLIGVATLGTAMRAMRRRQLNPATTA